MTLHTSFCSRRVAGSLIGLVAAAGLSLGATPAGAQTIEDALSAAYRSNPQILAERARLRATDEGVPRALSNWRPTVTLSGQAGKAQDNNRARNDSGNTVFTDRSRTPEQANLQVSQPLYRGGRTVAETNRAENLVQRGRAQLKGAEQTVLLDAATAYTNLLRDQAVLELNINNEQVLQRQLDAVRDRFSVGEVTRTDVSQAEARLSRARADRIQAEGNLASSRATYQKVIGELPGRLTSAQLPRNLPQSETQALNAAAENPNVVSARFTERAAADDVDLVAGEQLPSVNLTGDLTRSQETQTRGFERDTSQILLTLTVPLYQAGSTDARVREAKQTANQRRIEIDDALRRAREDATRSWEALTTARARIVAFQAQIRAAEIALEGVQQEARVGSRTVLDVLDAEQELLTARVNLVQSQRDEIVAGYQLAAATGRLGAAELGLKVEIYDPAANYNSTRSRWIGNSIDGEDAAR